MERLVVDPCYCLWAWKFYWWIFSSSFQVSWWIFTSHPTFLNWNRLNSIVRWWIYESISVSILGYLSNGMTLEKQWVALEESYSIDFNLKLRSWGHNFKHWAKMDSLLHSACLRLKLLFEILLLLVILSIKGIYNCIFWGVLVLDIIILSLTSRWGKGFHLSMLCI